MKTFVFVVLSFALLPFVYLMAEGTLTYPSISEIDKILIDNNYSSMDSLCAYIASMEEEKRCHKYEVLLLHKVLDKTDVNFLLSLMKNKIGIYDKNVDSITPLEYFIGEPLKTKMERLNHIDSNITNESLLHINYILQLLPFFQDSVGSETFAEIMRWIDPEGRTALNDSLQSITISIK